jgi:hypothetical protein
LYYVSESIPGTDEFIQTHFEEVDIFVAIGGDGTISTVAKKPDQYRKSSGNFSGRFWKRILHETRFSKNLDELLEKIKAKNPERSTRLQ